MSRQCRCKCGCDAIVPTGLGLICEDCKAKGAVISRHVASEGESVKTEESGPPSSCLTYEQMAAVEDWTAFPWPDWVPEDQREHIERFWGPCSRRTVQCYARSAKEPYNNAPEMGTRVVILDDTGQPCQEYAEGRYVHAWNNIGRVIHDDGAMSYVSLGSGKVWRFGRSFRSIEKRGEAAALPGSEPHSTADAPAPAIATAKSNTEPQEDPVNVLVQGLEELFAEVRRTITASDPSWNRAFNNWEARLSTLLNQYRGGGR